MRRPLEPGLGMRFNAYLTNCSTLIPAASGAWNDAEGDL